MTLGVQGSSFSGGGSPQQVRAQAAQRPEQPPSRPSFPPQELEAVKAEGASVAEPFAGNVLEFKTPCWTIQTELFLLRNQRIGIMSFNSLILTSFPTRDPPGIQVP